MRLRLVGSMVAALVATTLVPAAAAVRAGEPGGPGVPGVPVEVCPSVLACGDDLAEALTIESKIPDHMVWGQVVPVRYTTPERIPGQIVDAFSWGDSGLWTGTYLAAESFRYANAKQRLGTGSLSPKDQAFWTAQRDEAKQRVTTMVAKYDLLTNIAAGWQTTFAPNPDPTKPSFGGGVIQGEPGMLMRACAPTDAPAKWDMPPNKRVFGPWPWKDGKQYVCETAPSRDTYAGTSFGLLTAFDLVSGDDPAMRASIRDNIIALTSFLVKYGWNYPRPHGNVVLPPGHDFDNFASPLFVYVPLARLNMAQAARHVAAVAGTSEQQNRWNAMWAEELASQGPILAASMEVDAVQPNAGYYKYNLHHLTGFSTTRLAADPNVRLLLKQALGVMDKTTGDDVNAHFEAITYALTGEQARLDAAVRDLRAWRGYRARTDLGGETNNQAKCGAAIQCVPDDQLDIMVDNPAGGPPADVTVPGTATKLRARLPLPVADRPPTDFLWQRPPTQLNGSTDAAIEEVGIDYLLPYWMLRYYTEIQTPALEPFPAWKGPAHQ